VTAAAAACLAAALALDIAGVGWCAPDGFAAAGLALLILAVIFPRRPGGGT
jgi:hypothetical protein